MIQGRSQLVAMSGYTRHRWHLKDKLNTRICMRMLEPEPTLWSILVGPVSFSQKSEDRI